MGFGASNEIKEGAGRKFFTGVENMKIVAVNPSKSELEEIYGRELSYEPDYLGEQTVKDADGEREAKQVRIDFFLDNDDSENPITTKASFYVIDTYHKSQSNKYRVINDYGKTQWFPEENVKSKTAPSSVSWYNVDGVKVAKRGEEELVDFIANMLNIPYDVTKANNPSDCHAKFEKEQWEAIFKGDFSYLKTIVESTNNKVGVALGVKVADDKSMRQVIFNKKTLRQYVLPGNKADKYKWLDKAVKEAKANGAYGTTSFGPDDYTLREFTLSPDSLSTDNLPPEEDVFDKTNAPASDDMSWL